MPPVNAFVLLKFDIALIALSIPAVPKTSCDKLSTSIKGFGQYDLDGNLIRTWLYMMKIEKELGYKSAQISKCCNGKIKTSYGFIWKFI